MQAWFSIKEKMCNSVVIFSFVANYVKRCSLQSIQGGNLMLYDLTAVQFSKMLKNLSLILDEGQAYAHHKKFDMEVLLNARLAPDQFNLIRQVQIACDTAKIGVARLTDKLESVPKHEDNETNLEQLQARIASVIDYLSGFSAHDFVDAAAVHVSQPRWEGKYMTGYEFAIEHCIPNLYFHVTTAYSILRHNGVDIGKKDYLGPMPLKA
jgi:uncharacterized protein